MSLISEGVEAGLHDCFDYILPLGTVIPRVAGAFQEHQVWFWTPEEADTINATDRCFTCWNQCR